MKKFIIYFIFIEAIIIIFFMIRIKNLTANSIQLSLNNIPNQTETNIFGEEHVIHPYLGFVENYNKVNKNVNPFGFVGPSPQFQENKNDYVVAITGGSVARLFYLYEKDYFVNKLKKMDFLKDKNIKLISLANSGYKEPQQLMTLTYFLSLGAKFDMIINIDGFNEAALSYIENAHNGVSSFYPRSWNIYGANIYDENFNKILPYLKKINQLKAKIPSINNFFSKSYLNRLDFIKKFLINWTIADIEIETNKINNININNTSDYQISGPEKYYSDNEKIIENIVNTWKNSSIELGLLAKSNGITYLQFLQPNQYFPNSKTLTNEEKKYDYSDNQPYKDAIEKFYPKFISQEQELENKGVQFFDMTEIFKSVDVTIYNDNCCHYNELGNRMIADFIVNKIQASQ
ncbi:hypothetical protein M1328_02305 [Patescibacteria group bacterium]|nr:hypothetical protein [Patescibacteria group bacterium]